MQRSRTRKRILLALSAVVAAVILATAMLVASGLSEQLGAADAALVLGSKVELDGTPSPRLRARLDRTVELYRAGYFPTVIASGGTGKEGYDEAAIMRDYLVSNGIPKNRVITDSLGTTTFMSARNTLEIARQQNFKSVLVVSQYFHLPRARLALRRFGIATVYSSHPHFFEARDVYSSLRELLGYPSYFFRHYESDAVKNAGA